MTSSLKVILWGEEIGRLAWDERRRLAYFMYNPEWIKRGLNISPLVAPIDGARGLAPVWGEDARIYQKLPAFVADSLPDAWGNQLFDLWRQQNHLANTDITPLDKLSFIGKRGMGALEFQPEYARERKAEKIDMKSLADLAERIYTEREQARIMPDESITMQSLLTVGTSAGGRQPKAIIAINRKTGEIRSGQISGLKNYDYCLLKFGNTQYSSAELEMAYYELATMAGIRMMPSELYTVDGNNHFITKRFDRDGERKIYTQTLAAISPDADSYEQLIAVCRKLHLPESDCQEVFRRMVFNILANNTDDHNKNFSFIMDEDGSWRLSPAYDITFARDNGIRRPDAIIRDVAASLKQFRSIATKYGVSDEWTGRVETTIIGHLKAWGEWDESELPEFSMNGHSVSNIRMEQAYKGNYHLLVEIDGKERKFVIGKNKEEFALIEKTGLANLAPEQLKTMIEKYFFS